MTNSKEDIFEKAISFLRRASIFVLKIVSVLAIIGLLIWGGYASYEYFTETRHKNNIIITLDVSSKNGCGDDFPVRVSIRNNSSKIVEDVSIRPKATKVGYSTDLTSSYIQSDKIINPKEDFSLCWIGELSYGYSGKYKVRELVWSVESFYVNFQND